MNSYTRNGDVQLKELKNIEYNTMKELDSKLYIFINEIKIQDSFFSIEDKDDPIYNSLKSEEKNELIKYFTKKKIDFTKNLDLFLEVPKFSFSSLSSKLIDLIQGNSLLEAKIKDETTNIDIKLDHLSILVLGRNKVGKTTLIHKILKLTGVKSGKMDKNYPNIEIYHNEQIPYLQLYDTKGFDLNNKSQIDSYKKEIFNFINEQSKDKEINKYIHCIWYCVTGKKFEQEEYDLLNEIRKPYKGQNIDIPILIVYTQATLEDSISEMLTDLRQKEMDKNLIKVLAERTKLINNLYIESFGLDELVNETFQKSKEALQGNMSSVILSCISDKVICSLKEDNSKIKEKIYKKIIGKFNEEYNIKTDDNYIHYIAGFYQIIVQMFFHTSDNNEISLIKNSELISQHCVNYINECQNLIKHIIEKDVLDLALICLELQVMKEIKSGKNIQIKNKRCKSEFVKTCQDFLNDNFRLLSQKYYVKFIISNIIDNFMDALEEETNNRITSLLCHENIKEDIIKIFFKQYEDFENNILKKDNKKKPSFNCKDTNDDAPPSALYEFNDYPSENEVKKKLII
jgi:hypothetical protein